jgi:hypothetical protein
MLVYREGKEEKEEEEEENFQKQYLNIFIYFS